MKSLLKDAKFTQVGAAAVAGTTDQTSSVLDMSGYDSVMFIALTGDGTSGTVLELQVFGNAANSTSGGTELTADSAQFTSSSGTDADNKVLIVDVLKPNYRYVFCTLVIDTQNCVTSGILAIQYNARTLPQSQHASVIASALLGPLS